MPWLKTEFGAVHIKMPAPPRRRCSACGRLKLREEIRLCDARLKKVRKGRKTNTCNKPVCAKCTTVPAPEKDLCPNHAAQYAALLANPRVTTSTKPKAEAADEPKQERLI